MQEGTYKIQKLPQALFISFYGKLSRFFPTELMFEELEPWEQEGFNYWIVDLTGVTTMDSSGLSLLLQLLARTRQNGGDLLLLKPDPKLEKLLLITKLQAIFNMKENLDEAISEVVIS